MPISLADTVENETRVTRVLVFPRQFALSSEPLHTNICHEIRESVKNCSSKAYRNDRRTSQTRRHQSELRNYSSLSRNEFFPSDGRNNVVHKFSSGIPADFADLTRSGVAGKRTQFLGILHKREVTSENCRQNDFPLRVRVANCVETR